MALVQTSPREQSGGFRHEALLYAGRDALVETTATFARNGLEAGDAVLVAVDQVTTAALRSELGAEASRVSFVDMAVLGHNPGRILPACRAFLDAHSRSRRRCRAVGEPIYPQRSAKELVECQRHESLLNVAFAEAADLWLLCAYDVGSLAPAVIDEARRSHPHLLVDGAHSRTADYDPSAMAGAHLDAPLEPLPAVHGQMDFGTAQLREVREYVAGHLAAVDMPAARAFDLLVAVSEIATNSLRHGGGVGTLRVGLADGTVVCELADSGQLNDPLAGRREPSDDGEHHRGLWLANQLCDLVQIRVFPAGTVIRLHMSVTG